MPRLLLEPLLPLDRPLQRLTLPCALCLQIRIFKGSNEEKKNCTVILDFESEEEAYSWACSMWYGGAEKVTSPSYVPPSQLPLEACMSEHFLFFS